MAKPAATAPISTTLSASSRGRRAKCCLRASGSYFANGKEDACE